MILERMYDYVHYITPQFSRTDVTFQRVPTVDTSNPFAATSIPTNDESFSVVRIRNQEKLQVDFKSLLNTFAGSFMSAADTIVIPAAKKIQAIETIINPAVHNLLQR